MMLGPQLSPASGELSLNDPLAEIGRSPSSEHWNFMMPNSFGSANDFQSSDIGCPTTTNPGVGYRPSATPSALRSTSPEELGTTPVAEMAVRSYYPDDNWDMPCQYVQDTSACAETTFASALGGIGLGISDDSASAPEQLSSSWDHERSALTWMNRDNMNQWGLHGNMRASPGIRHVRAASTESRSAGTPTTNYALSNSSSCASSWKCNTGEIETVNQVDRKQQICRASCYPTLLRRLAQLEHSVAISPSPAKADFILKAAQDTWPLNHTSSLVSLAAPAPDGWPRQLRKGIPAVRRSRSRLKIVLPPRRPQPC